MFNPGEATSGGLVEARVEIASNTQAITGFGLDFVYDTATFKYLGMEWGTLDADWATLTGTESTPGKISASAVRGGGSMIPANSQGSIAKIKLQVKCVSYSDGLQKNGTIENYSGDIAAMCPNPVVATFTYRACPILGDVNGDGNKTPGDAQKTFEIYLGKVTPTDCQKAAADVNCDGSTTPGDAQKIFEDYLGRRTLPTCCAEVAQASLANSPQTAGLESARRVDKRRILSVVDAISLRGEEVIIPVVLTNPGGIREFGFTVGYQTDELEYVGVLATPFTDGFRISGVEEVPGMVRIDGTSERPAASGEDQGALACLVFRVKAEAWRYAELVVYNPEGDLLKSESRNGRIVIEETSYAEPPTIELGAARPQSDGTLAVPIIVSETFGIGAFGIELGYDQNGLQFLGVRKAERTQNFTAVDGQADEMGRLRVGGYHVSGIQEKGHGEIVELVFLPLKMNLQKLEIREVVDDVSLFMIKK